MSSKEHIDDKAEDIVPEEEAVSAFKSKSEKKIKSELKKAKEEAKEYLDGWQRARADLINSKKESEVSRSQTIKFANEDLIMQILPVLDSFELALEHSKDVGVKQIYKQLLSVLESAGVKQLETLGEEFDPTQHDPLATVEVENKKQDQTIVKVIQRGYTLHDKLLRAPRVHVGEYAK